MGPQMWWVMLRLLLQFFSDSKTKRWFFMGPINATEMRCNSFSFLSIGVAFNSVGKFEAIWILELLPSTFFINAAYAASVAWNSTFFNLVSALKKRRNNDFLLFFWFSAWGCNMPLAETIFLFMGEKTIGIKVNWGE